MRLVDRSKNGIAIYEWECICGNTVIKMKHEVTRLKNKTCGCAPFKKICETCGKEFYTKNRIAKCCSSSCSSKRNNKKRRELDRKTREEKREKLNSPKAVLNIDKLTIMARESGLTYGQLQARKYAEKISWVK